VTTISKNALVPYQASAMFALVDDIETYPVFLPWCKSTKILNRTGDEVNALIEIAHHGLQKSFTTCNRNQRDKMIEMRLIEGPFRRLEGFWRFDELGEDGCKISLDLEFEFSNKLVSLAFGPVFSQIANSLVDAFCNRAKDLYGKSR